MLEVAGGILIAVLLLVFWRQVLSLGAFAGLFIAVTIVPMLAYLLFPTSAVAISFALALLIIASFTIMGLSKKNRDSTRHPAVQTQRIIRLESLPVVDLCYPIGASWLRKYGAPADAPEDLKPGFRIILHDLEGFRAGQLVHVATVGEKKCNLRGSELSREVLARISRAVPEDAIPELLKPNNEIDNKHAAIEQSDERRPITARFSAAASHFRICKARCNGRVIATLTRLEASMLRSRFPRTFELIDQINDRSDSKSYFREFESRIADPDRERIWTARESEFEILDRDAWDFLKAEAKPYLKTKNRDGRAWSQLISALNESRGYIYIGGLGCSDVHFIPKEKRNGVESPDVCGRLGSRSELCEVKTIHVSDDAVRARRNGDCTSIDINLPPEFLTKLDRTIEKAKHQLLAYPVEGDVGRSVLIITNYDDWLGEYKVEYYEQIDNHIGVKAKDETALVFFNSRTAFRRTVKMKNAVVINE